MAADAGGWRENWQGAGRARRITAPNSVQRVVLASYYLDLWNSSQPVTPGTTAHTYLIARECAIPPADGALRCTESLAHPSGYAGPALIALVTDAVTGEPMTLHKTWIRADGTKADIEQPRLLLGGFPKKGGVIRIYPDDGVTTGLAVGEGIETMLTAAEAFRPVWSCIDAGNLGAFPVLDAIEELLIIADNDVLGLKAADDCARRWFDAGRRVRIAQSPIPGQDLNDLVRQAA